MFISSAKAFLKKIARAAVIEAYWALDANEDDNAARRVIVKMAASSDVPDDLVVAELDRLAQSQGRVARRILREKFDGKS